MQILSLLFQIIVSFTDILSEIPIVKKMNRIVLST